MELLHFDLAQELDAIPKVRILATGGRVVSPRWGLLSTSLRKAFQHKHGMFS
jgi:hypothetical protein